VAATLAPARELCHRTAAGVEPSENAWILGSPGGEYDTGWPGRHLTSQVSLIGRHRSEQPCGVLGERERCEPLRHLVTVPKVVSRLGPSFS
jgi:hypothetical protein